MNKEKTACDFCGHPQEDHSAKLFNELVRECKDNDGAWRILKKIHPKLTECQGFQSANKAEKMKEV